MSMDPGFRSLWQLLLFPSWLAHQALPYDGAAERIIVSFNAGVHARGKMDRLHDYSAF